MMVKKVKKIILRLLKIMSKPEMLVLPGQLAFFFLLAIVPTVTLIAYGLLCLMCLMILLLIL